MKRRLNVAEAAPELYRAIRALDGAVKASGIDTRLLHLVKLRASQINGCAYCVDLHVGESLADGIDARVLHLVATWRESPLFDARDRAVLDWTECVTRLAETGVPDEAWEGIRAHFSDEDIARLIVAIGTINIWNRVAVASRMLHPVDGRRV